MIEMSFEILVSGVVLVVLAGSMLGSTVNLLGGGVERSAPPATGYRRPADWPDRRNGTGSHQTAQATERRPASSILAVVFVTGVAFLGGTIGTTIYQSPWAPETTLRHMAAALHCDLAERVGMAPTRAGDPGYHPRNDRDRNGIACETYAGAFDLITEPTKLSKMPLGWHGTTDIAQGIEPQ